MRPASQNPIEFLRGKSEGIVIAHEANGPDRGGLYDRSYLPEILDLLLAEEYEAIAARLREDIRNQPGKEITADIVRQLVDEKLNPEEVGPFKEVSSTATEGVNDSGIEPHGVAIFHCKFKEEKVGFGFAFDLDMNLIGLSIARE